MMNYFQFLIVFIIIPSILFLVLLNLQRSKKRYKVSPVLAIATLSIVAFLYTTPWDNYLVAESIWYYDQALVTGITIGWVPIEEYTFFIVQTILVGIVFLLVFNSNLNKEEKMNSEKGFKIRLISSISVFIIWFLSSFFLVFSLNTKLTYLLLILSWGLIPLIVQLMYGADIIWKQKKIVFPVIISSGIYLSIIDTYAIFSGIWFITLSTSTKILLGGILPIEEAIFFFLTTTLIVFGMILLLDSNSIERAKSYFKSKQLRNLASLRKT